jgi:hypothetical protein
VNTSTDTPSPLGFVQRKYIISGSFVKKILSIWYFLETFICANLPPMNLTSWLHLLLSDCCEHNKVREINAIEPWELRKMWSEGCDPTVDGVESFYKQAA